MQELQSTLPERMRLAEPIGEGRFAIVYRAHDEVLQRDVALKVASLQGRNKFERRRIRRELKISCQLRHPNIVSAFDGFESEDQVVLILPLFQHGTLNDHLVPPASLENAVCRMEEIADALDYLHRSGIAHGDIKPENILLDANGRLHLADFGSCHQMSNDNAGTDSVPLGSAAYLAPELLHADANHAPTKRADIYSLGATFFAMVTGRPPYSGSTASIIQSIQKSDFPTLSSAGIDASSSLEAVVAKACRREPEKRYETPLAFATDLRRLIENRPVSARRSTPLSRMTLWAKRNRLTAGLASVLLLVMITGTIAGTTGWVRTASRQRAFESSEAELQQQGDQSRLREAELQALLVRISAERETIASATESERTLRQEAEAASEEAKKQSVLADEKLAETEKLLQQVVALKSERSTQESAIALAERYADRIATFERWVDDRRKQITDFLAKPETVGTTFLNRAMFTRTVSEPLYDSVNAPFEVNFMVFNRQGTRLLLLGPSATAAKVMSLGFNENQSAMKIIEEMIRIDDRSSGPSRNWTPVGASFTPDGNAFATTCRDDSGNDHVVVPRVNEKHAYPLGGEYHAMLFHDANHCFVLRARDDDLQVVQFPQNKVVYSCRDDRLASRVSSNTDAGATNPSAAAAKKPLIPVFFETGTDPTSHLLFASCTSSDSDSHFFLHSLTLHPQESSRVSISVETFDCGQQNPRNWPHRLSLTPFAAFGIGEAAASTAVPVPLSNARFAIEGRDYRESMRVLTEKWQPIPNAPPVAIESLEVESRIYLSPVTQANFADFDSKLSHYWSYPDVEPTFDTTSGVLQIWGKSGFFTLDTFTQTALHASSRRAWSRGQTHFVRSHQNNSAVSYNANSYGPKVLNVHWQYEANWSEDAFVDPVVLNERLIKLADRLRTGFSELGNSSELANLIREGSTEDPSTEATGDVGSKAMGPAPSVVSSNRDSGSPIDATDAKGNVPAELPSKYVSLLPCVTRPSNLPEIDLLGESLFCFWRGDRIELSHQEVIQITENEIRTFRDDANQAIPIKSIARNANGEHWTGWGTGETNLMGIGAFGSDFAVADKIPLRFRPPTKDADDYVSLENGELFGFDGQFALLPREQAVFTVGDHPKNVLLRYDFATNTFESISRIPASRELDHHEHSPGVVYMAHGSRIGRYDFGSRVPRQYSIEFALNPRNEITGFEFLSPGRLLLSARVRKRGSERISPRYLTAILDLNRKTFSTVAPAIEGTIERFGKSDIVSIDHGRMISLKMTDSSPPLKSQPLPSSPPRIELFDGEKIKYFYDRSEHVAVVDGAIQYTPPTKEDRRMLFLECNKKLRDFELTLDIQLGPGVVESGILFHSAPPSKGGFRRGYQIDIKQDAEGANLWGKLYDPKQNKSLAVPAPETASALIRRGDWNTLKILCRNTHVSVWINGETVVDFDKLELEPSEFQRLGIEFHRKTAGTIRLKHIYLRTFDEN